MDEDVNKLIEIGASGIELVNPGNPGLQKMIPAIALLNSLYGFYISKRQQRAMEFLESMLEHVDENLLLNESFQDGMAIIFEDYIRERDTQKRQIIRNILFGFSRHFQDEKFELEKFLSVLDRLSVEDIEALSIWVNGKIERWYREKNQNIYAEKTDEELVEMKNSGQFNSHQLVMILGHEADEGKRAQIYDVASYLSSVGLLSQPVGPGGIGGSGGVGDQFKISDFGKKFVGYLLAGS